MSYSKLGTITIDHTKCGSGNSTDFVVLFFGTYTDLKTVSNGGSVVNTVSVNGITVPADLIFASDSVGVSPLKWEVEFYNAVTGLIVAWIKVATLDASVDTVIYALFGNGSITTWQGDVNGTWNSSIKRVYHVPNGSSLTALDSTSAGANGTLVNAPTAVAGQIDGAARFIAASTQAITASATGLPTTGARTLSCWLKTTQSVAGGAWPVNYGTGGSNVYLAYDPTGLVVWGDAVTALFGITAINNGVWRHIVVTYNGSNSRKIYVDGVLDASDANALTAGTGTLAIGANQNNVNTNKVDGDIDEVRAYNIALSADWITAEFNNQSNPSIFYSFGVTTVTTPGLFRSQTGYNGVGGAGRMAQPSMS